MEYIKVKAVLVKDNTYWGDKESVNKNAYQ
jgi:hypothetical protein